MPPVGWEHISFNSDYVWPFQPLKQGYRPLRNPRSSFLNAAYVRFGPDSAMTPIFVEGPITVLAAAATAESARRGELEVEVVDRLFVLANFVPIDRGDNVKNLPDHSRRSCPDSLFGATGTLAPNEKWL